MNDKYYVDDLKIHLSKQLVFKLLSEIYSLFQFEIICKGISLYFNKHSMTSGYNLHDDL